MQQRAIRICNADDQCVEVKEYGENRLSIGILGEYVDLNNEELEELIDAIETLRPSKHKTKEIKK
jgi:hypothetical protein